MLEIIKYSFIQRAVIASVLGGISCGIVGVWVILLNIPFIGVAMSHAAFAGAILGLVLNINPLTTAILFCIIATLFIGPIADKGDFTPNISISVIFSFVLGLAFLGLGIIQGPKTQALNFLWGNILLISNQDIFYLTILTGIVLVFLILLYKEIFAVLFNRIIAKSVGIKETFIIYLLLILCGATITFNLNIIGGILIFSLIIIPPLCAYQLTYKLKYMYILSSSFAIISCILGIIVSYILNAPTGASIIIISCIIFFICLLFSPKRRLRNEP